ncbi:MAG TPA: RNA-binding protein [Chromatiales bacterium]|nr:RNA-binding protein [Chromatiales bacterium]
MRLYIGNLPYSVDDSSLTQTFAQFGEVANATVIMDRMTGRSKGFGFVEMPNDAEAEGAIKALDNSDMDGRNIKVNVARPREERAPRRPRY